MAKSGGAVSTGAAMRLVHTIGVIRWVAVGLIVVGIAKNTVSDDILSRF
ncbi:hypothetical protein [Nocardioides oleivorans]|nr:hypothetical protein [Nocardioides oleivorans]